MPTTLFLLTMWWTTGQSPQHAGLWLSAASCDGYGQELVTLEAANQHESYAQANEYMSWNCEPITVYK